MRTSVDVHNALVERDIAHELVPVRGRFRRPDRIASVLGLDPSEVGWVTLFEGDGRVVAALTSVAHRPEPTRVAGAAGLDRCREVRAARVSDLTGFLREALPPVGLPPEIDVLVDDPLSAAEVLYFPGGEPSLVLKIRGGDLLKATDAAVATLSRAL
jgi:prolyl-tRNA editing enzyme YbaK/EbsC (Cys-tRNA(Pro) deacylase)